ncbi:MAG: zinc metalloprotease HtpX [bacterium]
MNTFKTFLLMLLLTLLLVAIGSIWGRDGMLIALFFAGAMNFFSYYFSDRLVLAMYGAQEVHPSEPEGRLLYPIVEELSTNAGIPTPRVYIIPHSSPNAFATGRNPQNAAVAVTAGLLQILTPEEIKGVLAHEISHIKHRDTLIAVIAATLAGAIMFIARMLFFFAPMGGDDREGNILGIVAMLVLAIFAPLAALLIQMAISRSREYAADEAGAKISGNPLYLASALEKLQLASSRVPLPATPNTSHLFIVNPLRGGDFLVRLFSTHPPIEDRVRRLREMAYSMGLR